LRRHPARQAGGQTGPAPAPEALPAPARPLPAEPEAVPQPAPRSRLNRGGLRPGARPIGPVQINLAAGMAIEVDGVLDLRGHARSDGEERLKERILDGYALAGGPCMSTSALRRPERYAAGPAAEP